MEYIFSSKKYYFLEASRGARAQSVTVKSIGCGFDTHSRKWNIYLHLYFHFFALVSRQSTALSSAIQHAIPPALGGRWGTECLNTRFPLPTLLCAGYSVKLLFINFYVFEKKNFLPKCGTTLQKCKKLKPTKYINSSTPDIASS